MTLKDDCHRNERPEKNMKKNREKIASTQEKSNSAQNPKQKKG